MPRLWFLLPSVLLVSCGGDGGGGGMGTFADGRYGSLLNEAEFEGSPDVLPPEALTIPPTAGGALPASVLLTNLPAVSMQGTSKHLGSPGSCEAQSFGYGLGSYTAAQNPDGTPRWDASLPENEPSAAWLYRFLHSLEGKKCPQGSGATPYLKRLVGHGAPSAATVPYQPVCDYLDKISLNTPSDPRFRIGSYASLIVKKDPAGAVQTIKKLVASGRAVAFSGLVLQGYDKPVFTNGVIASGTPIPKSGHGQLIVGYDDTKGGVGAFLVQNSFGTDWPLVGTGSDAPPGMAWWSYDLWQSTQSYAATAYPYSTSPVIGTVFNASALSAPKLTVTRSYQWSPGNGSTWLILTPHLGTPVEIQTVTLTEPGTGTTVAGRYFADLGDGYVYFSRSDGQSFLPGSYGATIIALTITGETVTYTGAVTVQDPAPATPPAGAITAASSVTDTLGDPATVTPAP